MTSGLTRADAAHRASILRVESYLVYLDLTGDGDSAQSRTEIKFSCHEPGASTFADLDAVAVQQVTLNGEPVSPAAVADGRLALTGLAAGNSLVVDATVPLSGSGTGLTRYTDAADGSHYILANCFPTAAPSVFCCFDQPDLRAATTLIVTLPAGWTCVANGEPLHQPAEGAAGVWRFSTVHAMKPYEFTLCAGPYVMAPVAGDAAEHRPRRTVRCRASLAGSPGVARISALAGAAIGYYEDLLGVPCPYDKLDIVFPPELLPLAMQLPGVMYCSEALLQREADPADAHVPVVIAHEAAHLWFGCLVEAGWWDDLWLAEALANYLGYLAAVAVLGQPAAWAEFAMTGEAGAYQADSLPGAQPVSSPVETAARALARPAPITYSKGTAVIRQLAALIGDDAITGLRDYLTRYSWLTTSLADLIECWSRASGRELSGWAEEWLRKPGVNALHPEITAGPDGIITSFAVAQDPPAADAQAPLRSHRLTAGIYETDGGQLRCTRRVAVTVSGAWTHVPELTGAPRPAAVILNDTDLTFATVSFDPVSWNSLVACALDVSDPLAESVCWAAAWEMVQSAELAAAEFAAIAARRIISGRPVTELEQLLRRAATGASYYAPPDQRSAALRQIAAAALASAERGAPGSHDQRMLSRGYASCADSPAQLDLLRFWLAGRSLPAGLEPDLPLRFQVLATLAARDRASDADLSGYATADPVNGDTGVATLRARRPSRDAKEESWTAAADPDQPPRLALAHASGIWVPGQEDLMVSFRERYFTEVLPAVARRDARTAQRLARALFPATLADDLTLAGTDKALASVSQDDPVRIVLLEQGELLRRSITARAIAARQATAAG